MKKKSGWFGDKKGHRKAALKRKKYFRVCISCGKTTQVGLNKDGECRTCSTQSKILFRYNKADKKNKTLIPLIEEEYGMKVKSIKYLPSQPDESDNIGWADVVLIQKKLHCPKCGTEVWDKAKGHKLNKCWECGLAFDEGIWG